MGEGNEGTSGVAVLPDTADAPPDAVGDGVESEGPEVESPPPLEYAIGRRRFSIAAITAVVVTAVPFLWILWGPFASPNPVRKLSYETNFYDLQTRAIFHGHLWLRNGSIGIEAFVHGGREYTYFGIFPSILRMPVMLVTRSLDGKLTCPSILVAWLLTGLFVSLLLWRVRFLIRGQAVMGRAEATAFGVLVATVMGGTVWMLLAATPYVFNEDVAWSICLTVGGLFALLGIVERPSWGRVVASFVLVLAANLTRDTTGWALVVGAALIAVWFGLGRSGRENRRWCLPVLGVGIIPLIAGCAVNYSKFGVFFGVSNYDQVWTHVNAYRRHFLASNHNAEEGTTFVKTNLLAYLRPDGLRLTSAFPFITLPSTPPPALGGVLFDRRYRTASLPSSMPFLFLLSCWGLVTAFRPKPIGKVALTRFLLLASGSAGAALFLWGYIAPRYMGDFLPFLVLASAVAMADIWRRLEGRQRSVRLGALGVLSAVALFTIAANIGIAVTPVEEWTTPQVLHYVETQKTISDATGISLRSNVHRARSLPGWGPGDQLYVIGNCDGLYISNGEYYSTVPQQQFQRKTWMVVERGHAFQHTYRITFKKPVGGATESAPLVTAGPSTVSVVVAASAIPHLLIVRFRVVGEGPRLSGTIAGVAPGSSHQVVVVTDPPTHTVEVTMGGKLLFEGVLVTAEPIHDVASVSASHRTSSAISVVDQTMSTPEPTLCQSLIH